MPGYKRKRYGSGCKGSKRRRTYRKSSLKKIAPSRSRRRNFTKAVKKLIQSTAEVKHSAADPVAYTFNANNGTMSVPIDLTQTFIQGISVGASDGTRIGEQVTTKKALLKCLITAPTTLTEASILQLFIGFRKETPGAIPTAAELTRIFDDGGGTAPADGTLFSLMRSVNRDEFRIFNYKKIKVGHANAAGFVNNDFPAYRMVTIDLTKHLGVVKWSSLGGITNKHMYLWCNWVNPDGTVPDVANPKLNFYLDYTYTDT